MYFAEFYNRTESGFAEACGDRSVLILDGRESARRHHSHAKEWGGKHGFGAYKLCKGETFTRASVCTGLQLTGA